MLKAQMHRERKLGQRYDNVFRHPRSPLLQAVPAAGPPSWHLLHERRVLMQIAHKAEQVSEVSSVIRAAAWPPPQPQVTT